MPLYSADALVLRTYKLGEADRIVVFLTRDRGKKRGVAQSARRPRSRFTGALEPLTEVRVAYFEKEQRELVSLNYAEPVRSPALDPEPRRPRLQRLFRRTDRRRRCRRRSGRAPVPPRGGDARGGDATAAPSSRWPATSSAGCCACRASIRRRWPAASAAATSAARRRVPGRRRPRVRVPLAATARTGPTTGTCRRGRWPSSQAARRVRPIRGRGARRRRRSVLRELEVAHRALIAAHFDRIAPVGPGRPGPDPSDAPRPPS